MAQSLNWYSSTPNFQFPTPNKHLGCSDCELEIGSWEFNVQSYRDSKMPVAVFFRTWSHGNHCPFIAM